MVCNYFFCEPLPLVVFSNRMIYSAGMGRTPVSPHTRLACVVVALVGALPLFVVGVIYCPSSQILFVSLSLSLGIIALGSLWYFGYVDQALRDMDQVFHRVREGDLSARLYPTRLGHLMPLYRAANSMVSSFQKRVGKLSHTSAEQDAILRTMVEGVVTIDPEGRIRTVNSAARLLLDVSVAQVEGRLVAEVIHHAQLLRFISEALSSRAQRSVTITLTGSEVRQLEVQVSPLIVEGDVGPGMLLVVHDVTRVQRLENVRRDFVANVSHELRTPITSIKGFVETLLDGAMHDQALSAKFLGIIGRQAERLNSIFNDLLTLAKLEADDDGAKVDLEPTPISELVQAAVDDCEHRASAKEIVLEYGTAWPGKVLANRSLVEQAIVNLIENAIKYSEPKSVVRIEMGSAGEYTECVVIDQGPGIEKEHLSRLFERFYRVDQGRSRLQGGTGLGLAIVKHIAQVHGGKVEVQSVVGEGSRFSIFLRNAI
jgi:two-component system phosphate regulon sensor histidine kinase PhoR